MTDTIEHANGVHQEHNGEVLTGRKLTNAVNLLLSDLADAIDARFPHDGNKDSTAYNLNYDAHGAAYKLLDALLLGQPADVEHRIAMHQFALEAYKLYGGRADQDELVRKCIARAADDYRPDTPTEKQRTGKNKRTAVSAAAPTKAASK